MAGLAAVAQARTLERRAEPQGAAPLLAVCGVSVRFGGVVANNGVSIHCRPGVITALLGPNGAGKSTLFNVITGAQRPNAGHVFFDGADITRRSADARARFGIARTFQNLAVVDSLSVLENVEIGASRFRTYGALTGALGLPASRRQDRFLREVALRALEVTGLGNLAHQPAGSLPYGHLRRLEIARALALGPRLLLLDEPTAGMDQAETEELGLALLALRDQWALTILVVEHDLNLVRQVAEDAWVLDFGHVLAGGPLDDVLVDHQVVSAYMGRADGGA